MKSLNKIDFENTYANELNGICERCSPTSFNKSEILLRNYSKKNFRFIKTSR